MTATNDNPARTAETYRRRSLHQLAIAITNGHGWNRERADTYHHALQNHDPRDVDTACQLLLATWDRSVLPPPAVIVNEANQARDTRAKQAVRARETAAEHDRGIRRTEFDLDAPLCPRCNSGLMWLTDEEVVYCHACNGVIVMDADTGRVKLRPEERNQLRVAAGQPGRHMRWGPDDHRDDA